MPKPLIFMMDRAPAILPTDRRYVRNHMWVEPAGQGSRFGLSAYAVRLLGDIQIVEWSVEPDTELARGNTIGAIEGSKATTEVYAPAAGVLVKFNRDVLADPVLINTDLYDRGWLFVLQAEDEAFLSPEEYIEYLKSCWPIARRMLYGSSESAGGDPQSGSEPPRP